MHQAQLPNMKWVDNHKGVFTVNIKAVSSVHAQVCALCVAVCVCLQVCMYSDVCVSVCVCVCVCVCKPVQPQWCLHG